MAINGIINLVMIIARDNNDVTPETSYLYRFFSTLIQSQVTDISFSFISQIN